MIRVMSDRFDKACRRYAKTGSHEDLLEVISAARERAARRLKALGIDPNKHLCDAEVN